LKTVQVTAGSAFRVNSQGSTLASAYVLRINISWHQIGPLSSGIIIGATTIVSSMTSDRYTRLLTAALLTALIVLMLAAGCTGTEQGTTVTQGGQAAPVTDGFGRTVTVPSSPESVVCSGSGCLRYL